MLADWVGYVAMSLLVISFIPKQLRIVRILNLLASLVFVAYGILLGWKYPIIISNALVAIIQVWHLLRRKEEK